MVIAWVNIALIREVGLGTSDNLSWIVWGLSSHGRSAVYG